MQGLNFFSLFRFVDNIDKILMIIGVIGSVIMGSTVSISILILSQILDSYNDPTKSF